MKYILCTSQALPVVEKLLADGVLPVICGGTAYYVESLLWKILIEQVKLAHQLDYAM